MKVIETPIESIKPYENNPRKISDTAIEKVMASIKEFGFQQPIVVDKDMVIIVGHTRLLASKKLGLQRVPVVVADNLSDEQVRAYRLADNKTGEFSQWDSELLSFELQELECLNFDMEPFGFEVEEEPTEIVEDEFEGEPVEVAVQLGDIYQLGEHRLMCGDSTDKGCIDALMAGDKADMILSDPPYGMFLDTDFSTIKGSLSSLDRKSGTQGNKYSKVIGDHEDFSPALITTFFDNFKNIKECFLFGADYFAELLPQKNEGSWLVWDKRKESQADAIGSEFELCWSKNKHKRRMLRHDWFGFLSSQNGADARNRVHPTQKPVTLLADIIQQWGSDCHSIVDLFGGSGSTLIACEQLNRKCYMMELDPYYCQVIIDRWEAYTGKTASKVN